MIINILCKCDNNKYCDSEKEYLSVLNNITKKENKYDRRVEKQKSVHM